MIRLTHDGSLARITLDRAEARNAVPLAAWDQLAEAVTAAEGANARAILVSGAGGAFCAGADLTEFDAIREDPARRSTFRLAMRRGIDALAASPMPVVALIQGACFGAGVALAMAADIRIADARARFAITPAKIGIGYPQEDIARLVALTGPGAAARLLFTGAEIDGGEALRIGLVNGLGGADEMERLVAQILACDPASHAMLKRGIGLATPGITSDAEQDRLFDDLLGSPALAAALSRRRNKAALPPAEA